ncbi:unnamed protein product, partial [Chrysoparadoxa australica]
SIVLKKEQGYSKWPLLTYKVNSDAARSNSRALAGHTAESSLQGTEYMQNAPIFQPICSRRQLWHACGCVFGARSVVDAWGYYGVCGLLHGCFVKKPTIYGWKMKKKKVGRE